MTSTLPEAPAIASGAPSLSIVIASVNGWGVLGPTLDSIDRLPERHRIEVIVVDPIGGHIRESLRARRPRVEVIPLDDRRAIPRLRYEGVIRARGGIVAILEDHAEVDPGWAATLLDLHRDESVGAVGGTVENGKPGLVNAAVFFCEYAAYMGPVAEGETDDLPGNNIAYKRAHLLRHASTLDEGKWESWINDRLRSEGVPILSTNRAVVRHIKGFKLGYFLAQRFHFSRSYAGMRRVDQGPIKRLIYGAGSAVLPLMLMARTTRNALKKRRNLGLFAACSPLIALFFAVGAAGEMAGYLIGPGDSLQRVE